MSSIRDEELANLKIGDVIYECENWFGNLEARVTSEPVETTIEVDDRTRKQWSWSAENTQTGEPINYLITEGLSHYGPRLYRAPQYCRMVNGEMTFPLVGQGGGNV